MLVPDAISGSYFSRSATTTRKHNAEENMRSLELQAGHRLIIFQSTAPDSAHIFSNSDNVFSVYLITLPELLEEHDASGVCVNDEV